jgi:hypothetical protein
MDERIAGKILDRIVEIAKKREGTDERTYDFIARKELETDTGKPGSTSREAQENTPGTGH